MSRVYLTFVSPGGEVGAAVDCGEHECLDRAAAVASMCRRGVVVILRADDGIAWRATASGRVTVATIERERRFSATLRAAI